MLCQKLIKRFEHGVAMQYQMLNLEKAAEELALISGQKPLITVAKSIAARLRRQVMTGAKVTLRGERMHEF